MHHIEFQASVVDRIIKLANPEEGRGVAVTVSRTVRLIATGLLTFFAILLAKCFLWTVIPSSYGSALAISKGKIKIITYLGTSTDIIESARVLFVG
jgi:hypothetical protein